jgi:hypothetical protein
VSPVILFHVTVAPLSKLLLANTLALHTFLLLGLWHFEIHHTAIKASHKLEATPLPLQISFLCPPLLDALLTLLL